MPKYLHKELLSLKCSSCFFKVDDAAEDEETNMRNGGDRGKSGNSNYNDWPGSKYAIFGFFSVAT